MNDIPKPAAEVALPSKRLFTPRILEVEGQSGHKYTLRELSAKETATADRYAAQAGGAATDSIYYRLVLALNAVDGEVIVTPPNKTFADAWLDSIPGGDIDAVGDAYLDAFGIKKPDCSANPKTSTDAKN